MPRLRKDGLHLQREAVRRRLAIVFDSRSRPIHSRAVVPLCLSAFVIVCHFQTASAAEIEGRIVRVGLFGGAAPIIRPGVWTIVEVALRTRSDKPFDGQIRVEQLDRDGDVITSVQPVALAPQAEWRPYQVYFVPYDQNDAQGLKVRVFDAAGRQVSLLDENGTEVQHLETARNALEFRSDDYLIVDLSAPKRLPHVALLDSDRAGKPDRVNGRKVRSMLPRDLPGKAVGLESVDAISWDDADPSGLTEPQLTALIEWVRAGGRLLITSGKNWQALSRSVLAEILPVTISGIREVSEAPEFLAVVESLAASEDYPTKLAQAYEKEPIRRCIMSPVEGAIPIPADCESPQMAYRRLVGRGSVTFVGASLMQLLPPSRRILKLDSADDDTARDFSKEIAKEDEFIPIACELVVARRFLALPPMIEDESQNAAWQRAGFMGKRDLYEEVRRSIGFEGVGTAFLLFAILFAIAYTLVATTGSFWYMKRRGWQHHAWSAFALVAITGTMVGTGMVWLLRGFSTRLWQTTIVDGHADSSEARATALFGIKTPDHTRLDLRLPVGMNASATPELGALRPVAKSESLDIPDSRFVASDRYESTLAGAAMSDVPFRATLKEFIGTWHGALPGKLEARLVAKKNTGEDADRVKYEFDEGSYIQNSLGIKLRDCVLITMPPLAESTEEVAGERDVVTHHYYWIGDIGKSGDDGRLSTEELRRRLYTEGGDKAERVKKLQLVSDIMRDWENSMSWIGTADDPSAPQRTQNVTPQQENAPLLLLSTYNLQRARGNDRLRFMRTYGRALDCTHQLTKRTAILIGWSDEAPPVVLEKNLTALRPERARTLYRFVIPVERKSEASR